MTSVQQIMAGYQIKGSRPFLWLHVNMYLDENEMFHTIGMGTRRRVQDAINQELDERLCGDIHAFNAVWEEGFDIMDDRIYDIVRALILDKLVKYELGK